MSTVKQSEMNPPKTAAKTTPAPSFTVRPVPKEIVRQMPKVERTVAERGFLEIVTDRK